MDPSSIDDVMCSAFGPAGGGRRGQSIDRPSLQLFARELRINSMNVRNYKLLAFLVSLAIDRVWGRTPEKTFNKRAPNEPLIWITAATERSTQQQQQQTRQATEDKKVQCRVTWIELLVGMACYQYHRIRDADLWQWHLSCCWRRRPLPLSMARRNIILLPRPTAAQERHQEEILIIIIIILCQCNDDE